MGKKRIKTIDLSQEEKKEKPVKKGRRLVKSGKQHGRLSDMGAVMLEEMEKRQKEAMPAKEKEVAGKKKKEKKKVKQVARPQKKRSRRYQALRKMIKPDEHYPLPEAIALLKKAANAQFEETVELHLIFHPGVQTHSTPGVEKKSPLAHIKIGKTSETKKKLQGKIEEILRAITLPKIKKAVITSTMAPGIKLSLEKSLLTGK